MIYKDFVAVNDELERLDCLLKASEEWSDQYAKDPDTQIKLIRTEARMEKNLRAYYRELSEQSANIINWNAYSRIVSADYDVEVLINESVINDYDQMFITVVFEEMALATALGAIAGEAIYKIPLGIQSTDAIIQELTTKHIASLVGKSIDKDTGKLIDNPKAKYRISNALRNDIKKSVQTSINLSENQAKATERLAKTIKNPTRAAVIAQTETVNAYSNGLLEFGRQSGATGKEWQDVNAIDQCADYAALGVVPLNYLYGGKYLGPSCHPRDRCGLRLVYENED